MERLLQIEYPFSQGVEPEYFEGLFRGYDWNICIYMERS